MRFFFRVVAPCLLSFVLFLLVEPTKASAQLCTASGVTISPNPAKANEPVTIQYLLPSTAQAESNIGICGLETGNDPRDRLCFQIRGCNSGAINSGTFGCNANSTFPVRYESFATDQSIITINGQKYIKAVVGFNDDVKLWLEHNNRGAGRIRTYAPNECALAVSDLVLSCDGNPFKVEGLRNGERVQNFTTLDQVVVGLDWTKIRGLQGNDLSKYWFEVDLTPRNGSLSGQNETFAPFLEFEKIYSPLSGPGEWTVSLQVGPSVYNPLCSASFSVSADGSTPVDPGTPGGQAEFDLCTQAVNVDRAKCRECVAEDAIWTAFGCIKTSKEGIVTSLVRVGIGVAGGFVLLSILYGAFLVSTSAGEPKRIQEGQEMISSAVMGLLFVIFSIIILRFIGVSILRIPGFGG